VENRGARPLQISASGNLHSRGLHEIDRLQHPDGAVVEGVVICHSQHVESSPRQLIGDIWFRRHVGSSTRRLGKPLVGVDQRLQVAYGHVRSPNLVDQAKELRFLEVRPLAVEYRIAR
jgi:hypothetical protein